MTASPGSIDVLPPLDMPAEGGPEDWTAAYRFGGFIEPDKCSVVLQRVACAIVLSAKTGTTSIAFGERGQVEEVLTSSVEKIRPLLGSLISNQLTSVDLVSHQEVIDAPEGANLPSYDMTIMAKNLLEGSL